MTDKIILALWTYNLWIVCIGGVLAPLQEEGAGRKNAVFFQSLTENKVLENFKRKCLFPSTWKLIRKRNIPNLSPRPLLTLPKGRCSDVSNCKCDKDIMGLLSSCFLSGAAFCL